MQKILVLALLGILSAALQAEEPTSQSPTQTPPQGWTGKGEVGLAVARGNSNSDTVNVKLEASHELEQWKNDFALQMLRVQAESADEEFEVTTNRYEMKFGSAYKFSPRSSTIGHLRYERDDFAAFEYQGVASLSYGYAAIDSPSTNLGLEIGPGLRHARERDTGDIQNDPVARGKLNYRHQLSPTTELSNGLLVESGESNTFIQNELGVAVKVNASLALKTALQTRHNTEVAPGVDNTDTLFTTNLVYGFKGH